MGAPSRYNAGRVTAIHTQLLTDDASGLLVERRFKLRVAAGPDVGRELVLDDGTTMVGTHADNTFVLTDATVSRYHLEIRVRRDGIEIRDLDTTNGTKHGGAKVGSVVLTGAARLRLGKHTDVDVEPIDAQIELPEWRSDRFGDVLGTAVSMRKLFALLARVAPTEATILLQGETGTGKEVIAEAIHRKSKRERGPFVVVDCGSIPHELIASELFGHARGSFTGASGEKKGLIESANGGTLFLDEIGELALDLQPQLLRVLERRQVRRVGETHAVDVDIRVVAATHRDLRAMVKSGTFREDLYYRLAADRGRRSRRCASASAISPRSSAGSPSAWAAPASRRRPNCSSSSRATLGRATCASCATSSSARCRSARRHRGCSTSWAIAPVARRRCRPRSSPARARRRTPTCSRCRSRKPRPC